MLGINLDNYIAIFLKEYYLNDESTSDEVGVDIYPIDSHYQNLDASNIGEEIINPLDDQALTKYKME